MKRFFTLIIALVSAIAVKGYEYSYSFTNTPISEAILKIGKEHPDINIFFIYKELDNYSTSADIKTDDTDEALRKAIGLNPISVIRKGKDYYIEALQHGKFCYTGRAIGRDNKPVEAATVMLLAPKDSTVLTYGITDNEGRFSIPCDKQEVVAKLTCLGYKPTFKLCDSFNIGTILMNELPVRLKTVNVGADNAYMLSDKSIFRPTQRQKNASQTATDLLVRLAIPQINATLGTSSVTTASGQPVAIYIDYVPASENDLKMMRLSDVKSVEYLENPFDPRFQGNRNVLNFRMVRYEYGGYVKVLGTENFIANSGFLQANARLEKNKMTYDIMGYGYYLSNNHFGTDQTETFHLPQENGDVKSFQRESLTESSKYRKRNYETSFRALYSGDKITANSQIAVGLEDSPNNDNTGVVKYTDNVLEQSNYRLVAESKAKYLNCDGYYYFVLPNNNSLTAQLSYSYSFTNQSSNYTETHISPIYNAAKDNTHQGNVRLDFSRQFSDKHSMQAHIRGLYEHNRTNYFGSVEARDKSTTKYSQMGAAYNFNDEKISASLGFGWSWLQTKLNDNKAFSNFPYVDASLSFVPNIKNSFGIVFHYSVWPPSSNYKSENIIHVSPFLWYTGNPFLKSHSSYDIGVYYTGILSKKFRMTVYANSWLVGNRAAFVYKATPEGIIRTIQQPIGSLSHYNLGINASTNQFDNKLNISGRVEQQFVHNGIPFNANRSFISFYLQALYYIGNFNFALAYQSEKATDNYNTMSGMWTKNKDAFIIQAGWSNSSWNIRVTAQNLQRWNWRSAYSVMSSENYSIDKWVSNASSHAFIQLSATYTFGYGKKVKQGSEITKQAGASSGILK